MENNKEGNINCKECGSSIGIEKIELQNEDINIKYICCNSHRSEDNLRNFTGLRRKRTDKNYLHCDIHQNEKIISFCKACKAFLCFDCLCEDNHQGHERINISDQMPSKEEVKKSILEKENKLKKIEENKLIALEWTKNLSKKFEEFFENQKSFIEMESKFCEEMNYKENNILFLSSLKYIQQSTEKFSPNENLRIEDLKSSEKEIFKCFFKKEEKKEENSGK